MKNKYYLLGHETLTNRGCEALIRGISTIIRERQPEAAFLALSANEEADRKQMADSNEMRICFVPTYPLPFYFRAWGKLHRVMPVIRRAWTPSPGIPKGVKQRLLDTTAGIMTGGDILSLDYGVPSLIVFVGQAESYMAERHPLYLWAASIGPFKSQPDLERYMVRHLAKYSGISVRESSSRDYLETLGFRNVKLVADPAFVMVPEFWDISTILPSEFGGGLLGFNISPLIKSFRNTDSDAMEMEAAVINFLQDVIEQTDLSIVLIPHVDSIDGNEWNSDYLYMQHLIKSILLRPEKVAARISLAPRDMNAIRTKYLISQCRYFIGARTHATIAAWSTHVPTISIAYSVKATGLNTDLFGDLRYVLETPRLSRATLWESLVKLRADEQSIKTLLQQRIPEWQRRARCAVDHMIEVC
jgi:polysaccharide pyruvyl transferase WcaK-like protein